jgi:hypothetical protein
MRTVLVMTNGKLYVKRSLVCPASNLFSRVLAVIKPIVYLICSQNSLQVRLNGQLRQVKSVNMTEKEASRQSALTSKGFNVSYDSMLHL